MVRQCILNPQRLMAASNDDVYISPFSALAHKVKNTTNNPKKLRLLMEMMAATRELFSVNNDESTRLECLSAATFIITVASEYEESCRFHRKRYARIADDAVSFINDMRQSPLMTERERIIHAAYFGAMAQDDPDYPNPAASRLRRFAWIPTAIRWQPLSKPE